MSLIPIDRTSGNYLYDASSYNTPSTSSVWQCSFWIYDTSSTHRVLYTDATPCVSIISQSGHVQVYDGTNYSDSTLSANTGWTNILLTHDAAGTVSCMQDGTAVITSPNAVSASAQFGSGLTLMRGGATLFDLRIKDGTCDSTAWTYYRQNVLAGGDIFLPGA